MRTHQKTVSSLVVLSLGMALVAFALASDASAQTAGVPTQNVTPRAVVKNIVVNNQETPAVDRSQAMVTRAGNAEIESVSAGLLLFKGDMIETFGNTRVTLIFLDEPVPERDNEIILDGDTRISISSSYSWWGKIWVKVKGAFSSNSSYVRLGAKGTEYEFRVERGTERSALIVLEGTVQFEKGTFFPATARERIDFGTPSVIASLLFQRRETNFAHRFSGQLQAGRTLDVPAGQSTEVTGTYHILNDCGEAHRFEFRTSDATSWLQLSVPRTVAIPPRRSVPVQASLKIDARNLSAGQYRTNVYAVCLDCNREPRCTQYQLNWPLNVTVGRGPVDPSTSTSSTTQTGTTTRPQSSSVGELQEVVLTTGLDQVVPTTEIRVRSVLAWTNDVILTTQPSYVAQNIIPHFATVEERSQSFRNARERAILLKGARGSNTTLGHVYSDWGQGALAVTAYSKEARLVSSPPPTLMVNLSEAYRLTGQLPKARETLNEALGAIPQSALALNADGNLKLKNAEIALDKGNNAEARTFLEQAQTSYGFALQGVSAQTGPVANSIVVKSNLGEAYIADGNVAQRENNIPKAKTQYQAAVSQLESIQQATSQYPFPVTDLGRAYQGLGDAAVLESNKAEAIARYREAQAQHEKAIAAHPDFAEAYHNLGDLFDDLGNKERAKENYEKAINARPEQPASYYPLAVLIQKENPKLAAALASTYLKLEPEVYKQGQKAKNARLIERQLPVDSPVRPGALLDKINTGSTTTTTTTGTSTPGTVPNLLQKNRAEALSAIQSAGYQVGKIKEKSEYRSNDLVIEQKPAAGKTAKPGSKIELTISVAKLVEVPEVIDDKEATATRKITQDGLLKLGRVERRASCITPGEVIEQNPRPHAKVQPDTEVNLVLAYPGEDAITVPSLIGRSRDDAEDAIRSAELIVKPVKTEETNQQSEGTVLRQRPKGDTLIARQCDRGVEITVAVPMIIVGDYVGLYIDEARRRLNDLTLSAQTTTQQTTQYNPGTVISQNPTAGSPVRRRSTVFLVVAIPPTAPVDDGLVAVPPVRGMTPQEARSSLQNAGFQVTEQCVVRSANDPPAGRARGTSPAAGQRIPRGSGVKLLIAYDSCDVVGR